MRIVGLINVYLDNVRPLRNGYSSLPNAAIVSAEKNSWKIEPKCEACKLCENVMILIENPQSMFSRTSPLTNSNQNHDPNCAHPIHWRSTPANNVLNSSKDLKCNQWISNREFPSSFCLFLHHYMWVWVWVSAWIRCFQLIFYIHIVKVMA